MTTSASLSKNILMQSSTSITLRRGEVVGTDTNAFQACLPSSPHNVRMACCQESHSGDSSLAKSAGLMKGTSAPYRLATVAISSSSVETNTRSIKRLARAISMACAIKGFPASMRIFLRGTPFEPPRANIPATISGFTIVRLAVRWMIALRQARSAIHAVHPLRL